MIANLNLMKIISPNYVYVIARKHCMYIASMNKQPGTTKLRSRPSTYSKQRELKGGEQVLLNKNTVYLA